MDDDPGHSEAKQALQLSRWAARLLGIVASLVGCAFVIHAIATRWDEARRLLAGAEAEWLILGWVLAAAGMAAIALPWRSAQRLVGPALGRFDTVVLYFQGELGKYVPGAVWATVGRAELARGRGLSGVSAYAGVAVSLVGLYAACALVAAVALLSGAGGSADTTAWLLMVLPIGMLVLHPRVVGAVLKRLPGAEEGPSPPSWAEASRLVLLYVPGWIAVALATASIARAVTSIVDPGQLIVATTLSWLAGFLVVGAPGGLGVREAVFVSVGSGLPDDVAVAVAVLARMAFITADAAGAGVAHVARRFRLSSAGAARLE